MKSNYSRQGSVGLERNLPRRGPEETYVFGDVVRGFVHHRNTDRPSLSRTPVLGGERPERSQEVEGVKFETVYGRT